MRNITIFHRLVVFNYLSIHRSNGKHIGHKMYILFFSAAFVRMAFRVDRYFVSYGRDAPRNTCR
jgi:hypothetical protein